jgi:Fe-S-cluster containining protein
VFLSQKDLDLLVKAFRMGYTEFMKIYCRWVPMPDGTERLSLKEKSNLDCIFWVSSQDQKGEGGCSIYEFRPLQCRAFPFWPSILGSRKDWENTADACPGMGQGRLHSAGIIENWLEQQEGEPVIIRKTGNPKGGY